MTVKRNTEGLRQNAQKKRQEALEKVEQGIRQLIKEGKPINFNTVTQAANVSKAFLYKEPEIKARIEQLRLQFSGRKKLPPTQRASDASKDALMKTLKERIKKLEADNADLRRQNEVSYGHVLKVRDLEKENHRLRVENDRLRQELRKDASAFLSSGNGLDNSLSGLGVELNSTLKRLIRETPKGIVETAVESLREAMETSEVRNPNGFLNKAITDAWKPNEVYQEKVDKDEFNQWWKWAYSKGLVKAATQLDGISHVLTMEEKWIPFVEARKVFGNTTNEENILI